MTQEPIQNIISERLKETPFGATKTAELEVQFAMDPSFGLSRQRYAWLSDEVLFDGSYFDDTGGSISMETAATAGADARLRSAYPGKYVAHTVAEPGVGLHIPAEYVEYDTSGNTTNVSITHGEISAEVGEYDVTTDTGVVAHGISFEPDGVYVQIRDNTSNIAYVHQDDWNIDPLDGTGTSGKVLRPEKGYIYNFIYTWYGQGALILAIQDTDTGEMLPVHKETFDGDVSLSTPNMPIQIVVQNLDTAAPLGCNVGGMQFATHGGNSLRDEETGRQNEVTRITGNAYIDQPVVTSNNGVDPFAEPGRPLVSVRRDITELKSRTSLSVDITDFYINSGGDLYIAFFDEWNPSTALTGENFRSPNIQQDSRETRLQVDTQATEYVPSTDSILRGLVYVSGDKNQAETIAGDSTSRLPIDATTVVTAILPPGSNSTYARPALLTVREGF